MWSVWRGPPVSRKQARRDALLVLYQREVTDMPVERLLENLGRDQGHAPDEFTKRVVAGVVDDQENLDEKLAAHCRNWSLARLAPFGAFHLAPRSLRDAVRRDADRGRDR